MGFQAAPLDVFPATDVELKYSLQFGDTFNPQLGGKLPGLMMAQAGNRKGGARLICWVCAVHFLGLLVCIMCVSRHQKDERCYSMCFSGATYTSN